MFQNYTTACKACGTSINAIGHRCYCQACLQRTCQQCGTTFVVRQVTQVSKFCSKFCHQIAQRGTPPPLKGTACIPIQTCKQCGVTFQAGYKPQSFCSLTCSGKGQRGDKSPHWRGGVSREPDTIAYKAWQQAVRIRDGGRCRWCDSEGQRCYDRLAVHHIIPLSINQGLACVVDNGILLCGPHHFQTLGREHEFAVFLSALIGCELLAPPSPNRKDRTPLVTTEEELRKLYWDDKLGTPAIGKLKGVTGACVLKHMKRHGIPRRDAYEAKEASLCQL